MYHENVVEYEDSQGKLYKALQLEGEPAYTWHDPATGKWGQPHNIPKGVQSDTFRAVRLHRPELSQIEALQKEVAKWKEEYRVTEQARADFEYRLKEMKYGLEIANEQIERLKAELEELDNSKLQEIIGLTSVLENTQNKLLDTQQQLKKHKSLNPENWVLVEPIHFQRLMSYQKENQALNDAAEVVKSHCSALQRDYANLDRKVHNLLDSIRRIPDALLRERLCDAFYGPKGTND